MRHPNSEDVASAEIGGRHYALAASPYDGDIWIIDVTNPDILYPTATFTEPLNFPRAVEVMESGGAHYALVADILDNGVGSLAVINVTDPTRPSLVANVTGGKDGFGAFGFPYIHIGHGIQRCRLRAYHCTRVAAWQ